MRVPVTLAGLLVVLPCLCVPAVASRVGFVAGVHGGSSGRLSHALQRQSIRHTSRKLLQAATGTSGITASPPPRSTLHLPPPAAVVINATGDAPAVAPANDSDDNRGNFGGANFGFQFNNNVAFIGVAIILGLAVSCFWGVCGVYRRRRLAAHRFSGPPGGGRGGDIPEVQLVPQDVKLTVQPIVVIQPDNESIAYTFRELDPEGGKGSGKGDSEGGGDCNCAAATPEETEQQGDVGQREQPSNVVSNVRSTAGNGDSGDAAGNAAPAAAEGAAAVAADGHPAAMANATETAAAPPANTQQEGRPGEAVAALQEAGLLRRHSSRRRRPLGIPQLLEWDLGAALAALDAERAAAGDQPSLSKGVSSAALTRSPSGALAVGSRPGSFVALSRSPSGVLGTSSRRLSAAALQRTSGSLAAGGKL